MTALLRCDGPDCGRLMDADAHHIGLSVEGAPPEPTFDDDGNEVGVMLSMIGFTAETHLCSMACLASWAMTRHLDHDGPGADGYVEPESTA